MSCDEHWFRFVNWSEFPTDWVRSIDRVGERIQDSVRPWGECTQYECSYSFIVKGITRGKLAPEYPENPQLMIGFSSEIDTAGTFACRLGEPECRVLGPCKKPFQMVAGNLVTEGNEICEVMAAFLKYVYDNDY